MLGKFVASHGIVVAVVPWGGTVSPPPLIRQVAIGALDVPLASTVLALASLGGSPDPCLPLDVVLVDSLALAHLANQGLCLFVAAALGAILLPSLLITGRA